MSDLSFVDLKRLQYKRDFPKPSPRAVDKISFGKVMGLGDTLWLTPLYKAFKNTSTSFFDDERSRRYSFLFEGLTTVSFDKDSGGVDPLDFLHRNYGVLDEYFFSAWKHFDATQSGRKIFEILGVDKNAYTVIPQINVSDECLGMGRDLLNKMGPIKNPIILTSNNSGGLFQGKESQDWRAAHRVLKPHAMQEIINELSKAHTVLHCGVKGRVFEFDNVVRAYDLLESYEHSAKAITGLYKIVGKFVGLDSGDYNLMLAVGGECKVLIPDKAPWYNGVSSIFTKEEFKWEKVRTAYVTFDNYIKVLDDNGLSF